MDRRHMRAFTLSVRASTGVDETAAQGADSLVAKALFSCFNEPLDRHFLSKSDYLEMYENLPKRASSSLSKLEREPVNNVFLLHLHACAGGDSILMDSLLADYNRRVQANKRSAAVSSRINVSRVADALILLGLATLEERVRELEVSKGSARRDASQDKDKLPLSKRRKGATV